MMARHGRTSDEIAHELSAIPNLPRGALIAAWRAAYGSQPPKGMSRRLLERAATYHLQAGAFGGLKPSVIRRLSSSGTAGSTQRTFPRINAASRLVPGTRLVREWNGRSHCVEVCETGFLWNGRNWRSLSAVASAITGARWSGPRFFGL